MLTLNPYLVYNGTCEEAFNFYKAIFRAADLHITYYKDAPAESKPYFAKAIDTSVLHATLKLNEQMVIMGNDKADQSAAFIPGDFYLYVDADNSAEAERIFGELSEGGKVIMPIVETFWSPCYGVLTDRFGISWKITAH